MDHSETEVEEAKRWIMAQLGRDRRIRAFSTPYTMDNGIPTNRRVEVQLTDDANAMKTLKNEGKLFDKAPNGVKIEWAPYNRFYL